MPRHDAGRRLLFSHRRMVADLLEFIDEGWARDVRHGSLAPVQSSYVSSSLLKRRGDMVWKAEMDPDGQTVYIPIEFQSSVVRGMGLRWVCYLGLFNQSLLKAGLLKRPLLLPPSFPILLYNGLEPWSAPLEVLDLYEKLPGGLEKYPLQVRYHLLEERLYEPEVLEGRKNAVACMLRLENSRTEEGFCKVVSDLLGWFPEEEELLRDFAAWIVQVLLPSRAPSCPVPKNIKDLTEVKAMLAKGVPTWTERWEERGIQKGLEKGRREGRRKGLEEGLVRGQAQLLVQLLERKFGGLKDSKRREIRKADAATLQMWADRLLEAGDLDHIFNGTLFESGQGTQRTQRLAKK